MQKVKLFARRLSTWIFPLSVITYKRYSKDLRIANKKLWKMYFEERKKNSLVIKK